VNASASSAGTGRVRSPRSRRCCPRLGDLALQAVSRSAGAAPVNTAAPQIKGTLAAKQHPVVPDGHLERRSGRLQLSMVA
jgi:hypothetical protein